MENEGIMGLPEGQAMQNQGSANQPVYVSSADSYDAALTALGMSSNDPAQVAAVKQAVRDSIDELDLSPTEVDALLEVLEYMSQNPGEYPQIRQRLIDSGMMDPDDLPEAYDPAFLGMAIMALNEYQASGAEGAQAPMEMSPVVEGLEPLAMAEGGLADMAKYLASKGRNGDTMLAHITPSEARLLKAMGGSGTINPETGLPEFFLKKLFKKVKKAVKKILKNPIVRIVATVALATVLGPAGMAVVGSKAAAAALASGAVTAASGGKLKDVLVASATGYFGAGGTIGGVNPAAAIASKLGTGAIATGVGAGVTGTGIGLLAGMKPEEALRMGAMQGVIAGGTQAAQNYFGDRALQEVEVTGKRVPVPGSSAPAATTASPLEQAAPPTTAPGAEATPATSAVAYRPPGTTYDVDLGAGKFVASSGPVTQAATAMPTTATTFAGRVGDFFKTPSMESLTNAFLINPNATPGTLARYAPGVATALGVSALTGGFKQGQAEESPLFDKDYTGRDFIRDNPELFKGGLEPTTLAPYNPVVATPSYGLGEIGSGSAAQGPGQAPQYTAPTIPISPVPTYTPPQGSLTNMPEGIPQPYNVQGLYGVPLLYGNPVQPAARPPGYARGGSVNTAIRNATSNPADVAQTEALLYAGPQAAQQAGMAVRALDQGIMGVQRFNKGGQSTKFPRKTGEISGPGTGTSDSIPAMLSDGEFVFTAKAVRNAGQGSRRKGARRMYKLMKMLEGGNVKGK